MSSRLQRLLKPSAPARTALTGTAGRVALTGSNMPSTTGSILIDPTVTDYVEVRRPPQDPGERADIALTGENFRLDGGHFIPAVKVPRGYSPPAGYGPSDQPNPIVRRPLRSDHSVEVRIEPGSILDPPRPELDAPPSGVTPKVADIIVSTPPTQFHIGVPGTDEDRAFAVGGGAASSTLGKQALISGGLSAGVEFLVGHQHALPTGLFGGAATGVVEYLCPKSIYNPLLSGVVAAGGHSLYGSPQSFMYLFLLQAGTNYVSTQLVDPASKWNPFVSQVAQVYPV